MRYDLKTPCKNCPFRNDETRITFACRERAEEIEESGYRNGFPCHLSAVSTESDDNPDGGFEAVENSQHCVGFIIMMFKDGEDTWPGIGNDEDLAGRLRDQVDWGAPVFDGAADFIDANAALRRVQ